MKVRFHDIKWDTDNQKVDLPDELTLDCDFQDEKEVALRGADVLSNIIGWCVLSFHYEIESDTVFGKADQIKQQYLKTNCDKHDVAAALRRLMLECGEIFEDERSAWEFLMEETHEENESDDLLTLRLTLDVKYSLNGENAVEMMSLLRRMCERAIGEGMLTGETDAEVEEYSMEVSRQQEPLSEEDIADYMLQRIESGNMNPEDVPIRLARYGLMERNEFIEEMRERMESMNSD